MFAISNINGMSLTNTMSANFIATRNGLALVVRETMLAITNSSWVTTKSAGNRSGSINQRF